MMINIDNFRQSESTDFNCRRPLTPVQKDAIRADAESLIGILPYLAMLIKQKGIRIYCNAQQEKALENIPRLDRPRISYELFSAICNSPFSRELKDKAEEEFNSLGHFVDEYGIRYQLSHYNTKKLIVVLSGIEGESDLEIDEHSGYPRVTDSRMLSSMNAINYMMIQDIGQIIFGETSRGRAIPRFLPFYPTRSIVHELMKQYKAALALCSILRLDNINYEQFDQEDYIREFNRIKNR